MRDVFNVEKPTQELLEDFERLLKLLDHPEQIKARAPILIRDIHYLALSSSSGACLRALYAPSTVGQRIRKSIQWLRANFRESVSVEQMVIVLIIAGYKKKKEMLGKINLVMIVVMSVLGIVYLGITVFKSIETLPAYYFLMPLLGAATLMQIVRNGIAVGITKNEK